MAKGLFILDNPVYQSGRELIKDTAELEALEERMLQTRTDWLKHRETARTGSDAIVSKMMMTRERRPDEYEQPAREYYRALMAWARFTTRALEEVHNQLADAPTSTQKDRHRLMHRRDDTFVSEQDRAKAQAELMAIIETEREPRRILTLAREARQAVEVSVQFTTGRRLDEPNEHEFVRLTDPLRKVA